MVQNGAPGRALDRSRERHRAGSVLGGAPQHLSERFPRALPNSGPARSRRFRAWAAEPWQILACETPLTRVAAMGTLEICQTIFAGTAHTRSLSYMLTVAVRTLASACLATLLYPPFLRNAG